MIINITARHADISDAMKKYVNAKLSPILSEYPNIEHVHVILDIEKFRHIIEVVVQAKPHQRIEAEAESDNMYSSVDLVIGKLRFRINKYLTGHLLWEGFWPGNYYKTGSDGYSWARIEFLFKI